MKALIWTLRIVVSSLALAAFVTAMVMASSNDLQIIWSGFIFMCLACTLGAAAAHLWIDAKV